MHTSHAPRQISPARIFLPPRTSIRAPTNSEPWAPANVLDIADQSHRVECLLWVCAVTRRRFPVGASPRGRRSHRCWPTSTCAGLCWGGRSSVGVETEPGSNQRGTARRKGRQQICSAYSHCATPRLYHGRRAAASGRTSLFRVRAGRSGIVKGFRAPASDWREGVHGGRRQKSLEGGNRGGSLRRRRGRAMGI